MTATFDASVLVYVVDENAKPPKDPKTGKPVTHCKERIQHLLDTLQRDGTKIIIPTPALAEVLVKAQQAAPEWLKILSNARQFRVVSFDERAAIEFAATQASKASTPRNAPRQKAKFDDQIIAIAAVEGSTVIYSDDENIKKDSRFKVIGISELPLPPQKAQQSLFEDRPTD